MPASSCDDLHADAAAAADRLHDDRIADLRRDRLRVRDALRRVDRDRLVGARHRARAGGVFKNGYDSVLKPLYDSGKLKKAADQSVPDWDNQKALTIFEQMLQKTGNKIDGVLAANDGLGNAAISALKQRKLPQIPVTGQDATLQGVQNIVNGDQCMTVYKAIKKEADAAAKIAIALVNGETPDVSDTINNGTKDIPPSSRRPWRSRRTTSRTTSASPTSPRRRRSAPASSPAKCKEIGL